MNQIPLFFFSMYVTLTVKISISPPYESKNFFKSESIYSKTSVNFFSVCTTSYNLSNCSINTLSDHNLSCLVGYLTIFGCFSSFNNEISRIAVHGTYIVRETWVENIKSQASGNLRLLLHCPNEYALRQQRDWFHGSVPCRQYHKFLKEKDNY